MTRFQSGTSTDSSSSSSISSGTDMSGHHLVSRTSVNDPSASSTATSSTGSISSIRLVTSTSTRPASLDHDTSIRSPSPIVTYTTSPLAWSTFANAGPATIAPKSSDAPPRRVVPKRSRLGRLVSKASKDMLREFKSSKGDKENAKPASKPAREQSPGPNKLLNKVSRDRLRQRASMDLLSNDQSTMRLASDPATSQRTYNSISTVPFNPDSVDAAGLSRQSGEHSVVIVEGSNVCDDEDVDEVVVIKKQKSRVGLDFGWALGAGSSETTRTSSDAGRKSLDLNRKSSFSTKADKWWTLGRGRKDTKEKEKVRGKSKERSKSRDTLRAMCKPSFLLFQHSF